MLAETYPDARCELDFDNAFELLVVTVLSAQTTDRRVNAVRPDAVRRLPRRRRDGRRRRATTSSRSSARSASSGPRPRRCSSSSAALVERLRRRGAAASSTSWSRCPGVGRKTANVVLGNAFGVPGITVDTHFGRLVRRLGWTEETDPVKVEHAVGALFPKRDWTMLSHHLIWHGRRGCHAKKPACGACPVARWCPSYGTGPTDPEVAAALVQDRGAGVRRRSPARWRRGCSCAGGCSGDRARRTAPPGAGADRRRHPRAAAGSRPTAGVEDCVPGDARRPSRAGCPT